MIARTLRPGARVALALAIALTSVGPQVSAQKLDRDQAPKVGKAASLKVPEWTKTKLANGAELIVVEKHDLPLVALNIDFVGGTTTYEPADKLGVAALAAQMLSEGTKTKSADRLSDAQQMLGTSIFASVAGESGTMRFTSLKDKFEPAITLLADMLLNSTFPDSAIERNRARTLVGLTQAKDQPNTIAANVFSKVVYGDEHPYGRVMSEKTVKAITRGDITSFATAYFRPGRAVITVTGDIDAKSARRVVEKALAAWPVGGGRPTFDYRPVPAPRARTIYLIDKPKAAQSVFALVSPGPRAARPTTTRSR